MSKHILNNARSVFSAEILDNSEWLKRRRLKQLERTLSNNFSGQSAGRMAGIKDEGEGGKIETHDICAYFS